MRIAFRNEIKSYICYICEIVGEDAFSGGPLKTYVFYANSFFRVYGKNLKTNYVYNLMIHMFCLERFSLRWIINELFLKVGAPPKFKDFNKQWIVVSLKFSEFWYVRCMNTRYTRKSHDAIPVGSRCWPSGASASLRPALRARGWFSEVS